MTPGSGNGPFGFGWSLSVPAITRKTDKGLPQYLDGDESDVFILSGAEDLVPVLDADGDRSRTADTAPGYVIHRYRPRIEGLFARIERWTSLTIRPMFIGVRSPGTTCSPCTATTPGRGSAIPPIRDGYSAG